jgi:sigma-E factor negative regulatory protein RseB
MKNKSGNISALRALAAFCGLLFAAVNVCAEEQQASLGWLKIVAFAGHQTDFDGIFIYQYDNRVETSRITHVVEPDGEYEKLESLDGPKREIIRHHGRVWCYINHKMVQMDSPHPQIRNRFSDLLPEQLSALNENYQAREIGVERVAGYNTQAILFWPKDRLRYAHKIWVHTDTGLLLKAVVLGDKNQVVEQYAFTQLQLGGDIDRSWIMRGALAGDQGADSNISSEKNKVDAPMNSGWVVDALPAGFKKTMEIQRPMHGRHAPVTQIVFSDGLSAISIFIEPDDEDSDDAEGLYSRGAVNMYHKVIDKRLFTVVGEVPPRTLMQAFYSIRYNGK